MIEPGWDYSIVHQVKDVGLQAWNAFGTDRAFSSYAWYAYGEKVLHDCEPVYFIVSYREQVVARATFWTIHQEPLPIPSPLLRRTAAAYLRARPLFTCRSPLSDTSGLFLPAPPLREPALQVIWQAAREYARKIGISFLVFDYLSPEEASGPDWPEGLTKVTINEPSTILPLSYGSFADYLSALPNSVRKDYRRHRNHAEKQALTVTAQNQVTRISEALPLIRAVEDQHRSAHKPWAAAMLENADQVPSTWITVTMKDQLVGCGLLLSDCGVYLATLLGLDYQFQYIYFQLIYAAIQQSIEQGASYLRAGSGAYELKRRLGFQVEENGSLRFVGQPQWLHWLASLAKD